MEYSLYSYMLSCMWHRHCRIVVFSQYLGIKRKVILFKVICMDIPSDSSLRFFYVIVLHQVGFVRT